MTTAQIDNDSAGLLGATGSLLPVRSMPDRGTGRQAASGTHLSILFCLFWLLCLFSTGCSRFDHDWKTAVDTWQPADHTDISGPWKGSWQSEVHSSSGQLRCLISKTSDNLYHARFEGTYLNAFRFAYDVDLSTEPHLDRLHFTGAADLGAMAGGLYRYDGNANSTDFYCTYHSNSDHGHFAMARPESP